MRNKTRLEEKYSSEVIKTLAAELAIKNSLARPRIEKVVINCGIGEIAKNKEQMEAAVIDLARITGQKPQVRRARVSVASFAVRKGAPVGLRVTLRDERMYIFLDKLFSIVFPRLRDFRGLSTASFDKFGNYTLGLTEQTIFPEVDITQAAKPFGLEVTIVTSVREPQVARRLLELLGMPFTKEDQNG